jgi:hypothetical protein
MVSNDTTKYLLFFGRSAHFKLLSRCLSRRVQATVKILSVYHTNYPSRLCYARNNFITTIIFMLIIISNKAPTIEGKKPTFDYLAGKKQCRKTR